jgi:hypothetical protein
MMMMVMMEVMPGVPEMVNLVPQRSKMLIFCAVTVLFLYCVPHCVSTREAPSLVRLVKSGQQQVPVVLLKMLDTVPHPGMDVGVYLMDMLVFRHIGSSLMGRPCKHCKKSKQDKQEANQPAGLGRNA